jgi:hypothetical protein
MAVGDPLLDSNGAVIAAVGQNVKLVCTVVSINPNDARGNDIVVTPVHQVTNTVNITSPSQVAMSFNLPANDRDWDTLSTGQLAFPAAMLTNGT